MIFQDSPRRPRCVVVVATVFFQTPQSCTVLIELRRSDDFDIKRSSMSWRVFAPMWLIVAWAPAARVAIHLSHGLQLDICERAGEAVDSISAISNIASRTSGRSKETRCVVLLGSFNVLVMTNWESSDSISVLTRVFE
jgi:hypothetical protein